MVCDEEQEEEEEANQSQATNTFQKRTAQPDRVQPAGWGKCVREEVEATQATVVDTARAGVCKWARA